MLYCTNRLTTSCCFENEKCEKNFRVINDKVNNIRFELLELLSTTSLKMREQWGVLISLKWLSLSKISWT